jgi:hypothetical protein
MIHASSFQHESQPHSSFNHSGRDLENWALFEPFLIKSRKAPVAIRPDDVDLQMACKLLGLHIASPI